MTLGDGDDRGTVATRPSARAVVLLDGAAGNDRLIANVGTIDGGPGDDFARRRVAGAPGSVHFVCGPGDDHVRRAGDTADADCEHVARPIAARRATPAAIKARAAAAIRKAAAAEQTRRQARGAAGGRPGGRCYPRQTAFASASGRWQVPEVGARPLFLLSERRLQ